MGLLRQASDHIEKKTTPLHLAQHENCNRPKRKSNTANPRLERVGVKSTKEGRQRCTPVEPA